MKKVFNIIDKIIRSILVLPFTLILAVVWGVFTIIGSAIDLPCEVIGQIWEEEQYE